MRKNIRKALLSLVISASAISAYAQPAIPRKYIEHPGFSLGMNFGVADLWGDVGTQTVMDHYFNGKYFNKPCFMGGMFGRFTAHPMLAFRLSLNYGTLYANDNWNQKKAKEASSVEDDAFQRYLRNQDIRANVWETGLVAEFFPLRMNSESKSAFKKFQPYATLGVAYFHFRPQSSIIDHATGRKKWIDVRDLHVEGDGLEKKEGGPGYPREVKPWQLAVPMGLGVRWDLNHEISFGVEWQYRVCMTDRLDNVSDAYLSDEFYDKYLTPKNAALAKEMRDKSWAVEPSYLNKRGDLRGNKAVNDGYSTISLMLIYKINSNTTPWWF